MPVDWFTTIAQTGNFLLLVFLLRHFLYGPIIKAMEKREQKIARRIEDAESARREAEENKRQFEEESARLRQQKELVLDEAKKQAESERQQKRQEMDGHLAEMAERWQGDLAKQQQAFIDELARRTAEQVLLTASRALQDLAGQDLQERMIEVFISRLVNLDKNKVQRLRHSLAKEDPSVTITAVFALNSAARERLTRALHEVFGSRVAVLYARDAKLLAGVKLDSGNDVVAWNLEEYIAGLRKETARIMAGRQPAEDDDRAEKITAGGFR